MRIALIDSSPSAKLYPVGLLKIGSMLKSRGHECKLFYDKLPDIGEYSEIWISTVFTFDVERSLSLCKEAKNRCDTVKVGGICATLMPELFKNLGVDVHVGLNEEVEKYSPDYSLLGKVPEYSITHTSRGCVRRCDFCMVHRIEPKFKRRDIWPNDIHPESSKILFYDNNFLASRVEDIEKEVDIITEKLRTTKNKSVDFNQALDCRLLTEKKADVIARANIDPIRFSFDGMHEDGPLQKAITMMAERGKRNFTSFCLYNFEDTPEDFYYRMREGARLSDELGVNVTSFPMRYQPILVADKDRNYVGKNWTPAQKKGFMNILNKQSIGGQVSQGIESFEYWFTDSAEKFSRLISWDKVGEYAARKKGALRYYVAKNASESA